MRRAVSRSLLQGQDLCLFCAFKHGVESRAASGIRPQRRLYRSTGPSQRPAGAAAARIEEEEDDFPHPAAAAPPNKVVLGWKCRCNHVNASHRSECTICTNPRPQNAELVYQENKSRSASLSSPPPPPTASSPSPPLSHSTKQNASLHGAQGQPVTPPRATGRPQFESGTILGQASVSFTPYQAGSAQEQRPFPRKARTDSNNDWRKDRNARNPPTSRNQREASTPSDGPTIKYSNPRAPRLPQGSSAAGAGGDMGASVMAGQQRPWFGNERRNGRYSSGNEGEFGPNSRRAGDSKSTSAPWSVRDSLFGAPSNDTRIGQTLGSTRREPPFGRDSTYQRSEYREPRPDFQQRNAMERGARRGPPHAPSRGVRRPGSEGTDRAPASTIAEDEAVEPAASETLTGTEEDWYTRRTVTDRDRDRRGRVYDVEAEVDEPFHASPMARSPARKTRTNRRQSTPNFDPDLVDELLDETGSRRRKRGKQAKAVPKVEVRPEIRLPEFISVEKLAQGLKVRLQDFLNKLEEEGFEGARYDHILDSGTSAMFAEIYGFEPIISTVDDSRDLVARPPPEDVALLPPRPPIVTIMGHVDHGKTTILDYFRKSSVVATEHGGITQHIGAFSVTMPGSERNITFLDTPGHAAFLDMRRRGANVTDIVVLVVAADDSVKAQTLEAIKHALEANVQIIVAINKVDKEDANVERVKQDLSRHDIIVEEYGGEYQAIPVSGKTGQGMADLEEAILTLADVADFRAETDGQAEGWIIESKVGASGRVATVLVRRGTLRPGDFIVAGTTWARVRTLRNDAGQLINEAPPGTPVQIDGWRAGDPMAGDEVLQAETEQRAKEAVAVRQEREENARAVEDMTAINSVRSEEAEARSKVLEWEKEQGYMSMRANRRPKDNEGWVEKEQSGPRQVPFVIKADVAGSTEALVAAVSAIGNNEIVAHIIHSGTGALTESDIKLLAATGEVGYAISFNQPVDGSIRRLAEAARLQILDHNIIYKVTDDVKDKMAAELPPVVTQRVLGEAEVGEIFEINVKKGLLKIAGCRVTNGTIRRSEKVRVLRNGEVVYTGMLNSFKNIKKDVTEMRKGSECGMGFENWEDFQVGDQIQSFEEIKEKRTLY
ncbi:translation initiation factor IF-2 [Capronia coronata CBS 617.96]|uniref:Translation initiation factor IF-2, mitochondrial n=1 Tax=Capronia coronata CBS 617.96 TaxID=1182541 RepID=W9Z210_9EURO|nr:translation initiation factor IF-2 [Capronia coronata CBS 617.96]EXJ95611.1 translation initiation factor IF-2 [Capronia coronata CBS 617.96]